MLNLHRIRNLLFRQKNSIIFNKKMKITTIVFTVQTTKTIDTVIFQLENTFSILDKKPPNKYILSFKMKGGGNKSILIFFIFLTNILYSFMIPYIFAIRQQIKKQNYQIKSLNKNPLLVYFIGIIDFVLSISWQSQLAAYIYFYLMATDPEQEGIFIWAGFFMGIQFIYLCFQIKTKILQKDISFIVLSYTDHKYQKKNPSFFRKLFLQIFRYQLVIKDYFLYIISIEKQDDFQVILNLGMINHLTFKGNYDKMNQIGEELKNLSYGEKMELYNLLMKQKNSHMAEEDVEIIMINLAKEVEKDIQGSCKQLDLIQFNNLEFSYFNDSQVDHSEIKNKDFFLQNDILENNKKNHFSRHRDARKFISYIVCQQFKNVEKKQTLKKFLTENISVFFAQLLFPIYSLMYFYETQNSFMLFLILFFPTLTSQFYLITLIQVIVNPLNLKSRIQVNKIIKNLIDCSVDNNFINPSQKYPKLQKWDITSVLSMENWNSTRRITMILYYQKCRDKEAMFALFCFYVGFIAVFMIGVTDQKFTYKITWSYLAEPIIVATMLFQFFILIALIMERINLDSQFNELFDDMAEIAHNMQFFFREMKCNGRIYQNFIPDNIKEPSLNYAVATKIKLRIEQDEIISGEKFSEQEKLERFIHKCSQLNKTFKLIQGQIAQEASDYSILFANHVVANTKQQYLYIIGGLVLYLPFIFKTVVQLFMFNTKQQ